MMPFTRPLPPENFVAAAAVMAVAAILGALVLQHGLGYIPCKLCLEQRTPYYYGIPLLCSAFALFFFFKAPPRMTAALCLAAAALFAYGAYLGVRHAGVEWRWWEGPGDCGMTSFGENYDAASLLEQIQKTRVVSCTDAALRILGLSLAGWNAVVASCAGLLAAKAGLTAWRGTGPKD